VLPGNDFVGFGDLEGNTAAVAGLSELLGPLATLGDLVGFAALRSVSGENKVGWRGVTFWSTLQTQMS
jgi:hypothetical protein